MSVHKAVKAKNYVSQNGLISTGTSKSGTSDFGIIGQYGATTTYTGLTRHTDGNFYLFDGLTVNPFTADTVNIVGAGYAGASLFLASVTATAAGSFSALTCTTGGLTASSGTSTLGNITVSANTIASTSGAISILPTGSNSINLGGASNQVLLPADPSVPLGAATKQYVDNYVQGLSAKNECIARTTLDLAAIATAAGSGVTHTFTATGNGAISTNASYFDSVSLTLGARILVMSQGTGAGNAKDNGIYTVTTLGTGSAPWVITRSVDTSTSADFANGTFTFVNQGTLWASTGWVVSSVLPITLETSSITFVQFSQVGAVSGNNLDTGGSAYNFYVNKTSGNLNFRALLLTQASTNTTNVVEAVVTANDITLNVDQTKIVTTGVLTTGSIASGYGSIVTTNAITTTGTVTGATLQTTGGSITATGGTITFAAGSGSNVIAIADNTADAYSIKDGAVNFMQFATTTGAQQINVGKPLNTTNGTIAFSAASASNILQIPDNLASALLVRDVTTSTNFMQFVSTTGAYSINSIQPFTASSSLTVTGATIINGGYTESVTNIVGATTLGATQTMITADATSAAFSITLPAMASNSGRCYRIMKKDASANAVTIAVTSGDYLDSVQNDTLVLSAQYDHCYLACFGVTWSIL
jgi:hypothetical protein